MMKSFWGKWQWFSPLSLSNRSPLFGALSTTVVSVCTWLAGCPLLGAWSTSSGSSWCVQVPFLSLPPSARVSKSGKVQAKFSTWGWPSRSLEKQVWVETNRFTAYYIGPADFFQDKVKKLAQELIHRARDPNSHLSPESPELFRTWLSGLRT